MNKFEVGYLTEDPAKEYAKAIRTAINREELITIIEFYEVVASDALACAKAMTAEDFKDFKTKLKYAGRKMSEKWTEEFTKKYGEIVVPIDMIYASLLADQFHVPWGVAFIRHKEMKKK